MGVLVKVRYESGKVKYIQESEYDKSQITELKKFVVAHEGSECYKLFLDNEEINFNKKLPNFYRLIMLNPLFDKMKVEYGLASVHELDAVLSLFYLKKKLTKQDGTEYELPTRIEHISLAEQVNFIARVANLAITKYGLKFPNANEVDNMNK